jgi:coatomer subunit epsilon
LASESYVSYHSYSSHPETFYSHQDSHQQLTNSIPPPQGGDKYQSTFYIYEELASAPRTTTTTTSSSPFTAQALSDMHLNRLPEAEATLHQALETDPTDAQALANQVVLASLMGKKRAEVEELVVSLRGVDEGHALVRGLEEMEGRFDEAGRRYGARVATATR